MTAATLRTPFALVIEILWGFAAAALFVQLFGQGDGPAPSVLAVAAVTVASFVLARVMLSGDDESDARARGAVVSLIALFAIGQLTYSDRPWDFGWLSTLLSEPSSVIEPNGHVIAGMIALFALWLRGVQRGSLPDLDFEGVLASVSAGLAIVILAALTTPDVRGDASWGALAFAYTVVAMLTLAVFNASPKTTLSSMATGWPIVIVVLAGVALLIGLVAGTAGGALFEPLSPLATPFEAAGRGLREYVLAPILWLFSLPVRAFIWLLSLVSPGGEDQRQPPPAPAPEESPPEDEGEPLWFRVLLALGAGLGGVVVALVALWLLWRAFRRYMQRRAFDPRETREDLEPGSLGADLSSMFGALGRHFRRGERSADAVPIRRLYYEVLAAAEDRGIERPPSATPLQFAPALDAGFASHAPSDISEAFVESRYAERPIDAERVRRLRERWEESLGAR